MTNRKRVAVWGAGVFAALVITGCSEAPGAGTTRSWCDHGNRLYSLDTEDTRGETLTVVPEDVTCDSDRADVGNRPEGDTRPMPEMKGIHEGPYKPWKPAVKPAPKPAPAPVAPRKSSTYRLSPIAG